MKKLAKYKAGVVPCRKNHDGYEILTVSSRKFVGQWVFPVGTVEEGESFEQAAVRECMEESGYHVELGNKINSFVIKTDGDSVKFVFFNFTFSNWAPGTLIPFGYFWYPIHNGFSILLLFVLIRSGSRWWRGRSVVFLASFL